MELWEGSHHDLAMQVAEAGTVLGDFDGPARTLSGVSSTFFRREEEYWVRTEGPNGVPGEYRVAYTFGVSPLQQYLVEYGSGRYQALTIAWDSRLREEGGQRWFDLHTGAPVPPGDPLHWTGSDKTWNFMCAECHSTGVRKGYSLEEDRYGTTWAEIDVSCEACHGPASEHLRWAEATRRRERTAEDRAFALRLGAAGEKRWVMDMETGTVRPQPTPVDRAQLRSCEYCHSRRTPLAERFAYDGGSLLDTHQPALLEEGLYFTDGQIDGEVYVWGSFVQSAMYRAGVGCDDCHEPHSLELTASGNALCTRCHQGARFDTPDHHFHEPGSAGQAPANRESAGAECVSCHMPARTYMVVDPRRDHGFRVPRPDLSAELGVPNPCTGCHQAMSPTAAAEILAARFGRPNTTHFGRVIAAARSDPVAAQDALASLAADPSAPGIARATALSLLPPSANPSVLAALRRQLSHADPLVRLGALQGLEGFGPAVKAELAVPLLDDPILAVRLQAARDLAPVPTQIIPSGSRMAVERGFEEYRAAQAVNRDRAEAHANLGWLAAQRGDAVTAEREYRTALRLQPSFTPAYVNLSDLYRVTGRDPEGEQLLREGVALAPEAADLRHALGLLMVRMDRIPEGLAWLEQAANLGGDRPRYAYVYAVALHTTGDTGGALAVLEQTVERHPSYRDARFALATISRDAGLLERALGYARDLLELRPGDQEARWLIAELEGEARRR